MYGQEKIFGSEKISFFYNCLERMESCEGAAAPAGVLP